ncbi:MAG TPA: CGNR zinc finger domain-containing protein [Steroidobacteraceae bacterium]|nr:CGNR zinc finger domain-containing protein [Steroidobacteraceae bacterium]
MGSRPAAIFVGDAPGLDFLNSLATPVDTAIDWIDDGAGLVDWLGQARLVPAEVLHSVRARARPGELDKVAAQARQLREWFRGFVSEHRGRRLAPQALGELEPLNRLLERDARFSRIVLRQDSRPAASLELQEMRPWRSPDELLMPIVATLASLVVTEDFSFVKACEGPACTLLFADHTRGRARRWCSMAICGNRAKQAAHRQRLKARQRHRSRGSGVK